MIIILNDYLNDNYFKRRTIKIFANRFRMKIFRAMDRIIFARSKAENLSRRSFDELEA